MNKIIYRSLSLVCCIMLMFQMPLNVQAKGYSVKLYLGDVLISDSVTGNKVDELTSVVEEYTRLVDNSLSVDFSNANSNVQDVSTLLQKLLDRFYPKATYLYNADTTNLANNWKSYNYRSASSSGSYTIYAITPTISVDSGTGALKIAAQGINSANICDGIVAYCETIDFSKYEKLKFRVTGGATSGNSYWNFVILPAIQDKWGNISIHRTDYFINYDHIVLEEFELDVSAIDATAYLIIDCQTSNVNTASAMISEIWLE